MADNSSATATIDATIDTATTMDAAKEPGWWDNYLNLYKSLLLTGTVLILLSRSSIIILVFIYTHLSSLSQQDLLLISI